VLDGEAERLERSVRDLLSVLGGPGQDRAETTVERSGQRWKVRRVMFHLTDRQYN
jgi:hypothetical protein